MYLEPKDMDGTSGRCQYHIIVCLCKPRVKRSGSVLLLLLLALCTSTGSWPLDWCSLDTGYTTIVGPNGYPHSVYISLTREGAVWMRMGQEHKSLDWVYEEERARKVQIQLIDQDDLRILEYVNFTDFCVLTDLNLRVRANAWHPSYLVSFNPRTKLPRIMLFKYTRDCAMKTNITLGIHKQTLVCNGGEKNACGLKNLPYRGQATEPIFIKYVKLDPKGPDSFVCNAPAKSNAYTFKGSYYHTYVKVASCSAPTDSKTLGFEAKLRSQKDSISNFIFILDPTQTALNTGIIIGWKVFAKVMSPQHEVLLQVWRPLVPEDNMYMLVGQSRFKPVHLRFHELALKTHDQIRVRRGDVLGLYFAQQNPVAWSVVPCSSKQQRLRYIYNPTDVSVGKRYQFKMAPLSWTPCRQYSVTAIFENRRRVKLVEDWKCPRSNIESDTRKRSDDILTKNTSEGFSITQEPGLLASGRTRGGNSKRLPIYVVVIIVGVLVGILVLVGFVSYYCVVRSERSGGGSQQPQPVPTSIC